MPVTQVRAPSGAIIPVQHPEGATQEEILGYARANFRENVTAQAGDQKYKRQAAEDSFGQNVAAAFAGALPEAVRLGVKGMIVGNAPGEVQEWKDSMSGLMSSAGGKIGAIFGAAAPTAAAALTPAGQTVLGSAAAGGLWGMMQPAENGSERVRNSVSGAAWNAAAPAAIATFKTGKALAEPMTAAGNERIAGRVLRRFASDADALGGVKGGQTISGAFPTLAEETGDLGLANLQNILQSRDPRSLIAQRYAENNAARVAALTKMGGTDEELAKALARRSAIARKAYGAADAAGVDQDMAAALKGQIDNLLETPAIKEAMEAAKNKALNERLSIDNFGSPRGLKYLQQEIRDRAFQFDPKSNNRRIYTQLADDLDSVLREIVPDVKRADAIYARLSREPNRMQVARELKEQSTSALSDFNGSPKLYAEKFAGNLDRRAPKVVSDAIGRKSEKALGDVMSADQMRLLDDIFNGVQRQAAAQTSRVSGSTTARNLIGDDLMGQIAGPLGVPKSWAQSALAENFLSRPTSWLLRSSEERLNDTLLRAMTDPAYAAEVVKKSKPTPLAFKAAAALEKTAPLYTGGLLGAGPVLLQSSK